MNKLDGRVAIVTGAGGGIGRAAAAVFLAEGARVVLVDSEPEALRSVQNELGLDKTVAVAADVSRPDGAKRYVAACLEHFGRVDVLFANAGIEGHVAPLTELTVEEFDNVISVNVRGVWLAIREVAPLMAKAGRGSIILTSSIAALMGSPGLGAYVASKHAVLGLMRTAALELASAGVRVNSIHPGPIENRMMRSIESQLVPEAPTNAHQAVVQQIPMGRYGRNEEVARMALFLASDDSSYCTGGAFPVDGGMSAT